MIKNIFIPIAAALVLAFSSTVTASAAETTATPDTTETEVATEATEEAAAEEAPADSEAEDEKTIEDELTEEIIENAPDGEPHDYYADDYYDTKGNASLIKEESIIYDGEEMQFIAVTTKDGNVFYVLINYSAESGEDSVYFLNKVDSYDLYSLLYEPDEDSDTPPAEAAEEAANRANGTSSKNDDSSEADGEAAEEAEDAAEQPARSSSTNSLILIGIVAALGIGGFLIFKFMNKPKKAPLSDELDYDEDDDLEINEDDE